jgi:hypothetical protein
LGLFEEMYVYATQQLFSIVSSIHPSGCIHTPAFHRRSMGGLGPLLFPFYRWTNPCYLVFLATAVTGKRKQASVECSRTERMLLGRELRLALTSLFTWLLFSDNADDPEGYVRDASVSDLLILIVLFVYSFVIHLK